MKENEIPEEVRQEVRIRICNIRQCLDEDRFDRASSEGDGLITYILSAVRDGKLKLLGEVGRDKVRCIVDNGIDEGLGLEDVLMYDIKVGDCIIALRPEEENGD